MHRGFGRLATQTREAEEAGYLPLGAHTRAVEAWQLQLQWHPEEEENEQAMECMYICNTPLASLSTYNLDITQPSQRLF